MKILFLTPELPHKFGGGLRMYYQIKYLALNGIKPDIVYYSIGREDVSRIRDFVENLYPIKVFYDKSSFIRKIYHPYPFYKVFANRIKDVLNNRYDIIHVHKFYMAEYVYNINLPIVIDLWACGLKGVWNDFYYERNCFYKIRKLCKIFKYALNDYINYTKFKNFFVVSKQAYDYIKSRYSDKNVYIVPNGTEGVLRINRNQKKDTFDLIFTGDMSFEPNIDAVIYFYKKIYPHIKRNIRNVRFFIVGKSPSKKIIDVVRNDNSVIITGIVDDIREYLSNADIFIAPLRGGLGIRNKILEAMSCGLTVVGTQNAFEGINGEDGKHFLFAKTPHEFVEKILFLYKNINVRNNIGINALRLIESDYLWDNIIKKMIDYYYEILNRHNYSR